MIDIRVIRALHVEQMRAGDLTGDVVAAGEIFQTSTLDALLDGCYDGDVTFEQLARRGDLGLGTLDGLDGEMVAVDGEFHHVGADGTVRPIEPVERTPFAVVTPFAPDARRTIDSPCDHGALLAAIEELVADGGLCYAVRVDGDFEFVRARSVPRQRRPYPPLADVIAQQVEFDLADVRGSIVGFRFPDYAQGLNVPGYHLHFISDERTSGGHVLDCRIRSGEILVDHTRELHMELPAGVGLPGDSSRTEGREITELEGETHPRGSSAAG